MIKKVVDLVKNSLRKSGRAERKRFGALDANGAEILDSTPMDPPIGFNPQPSMFDIMRAQMAQYHADLAKQGYETPEEADDFEVEGDDFDPHSPYEHNFDPVVPVSAPTPSPEVPPVASGKAPEPPADGPAISPPATV